MTVIRRWWSQYRTQMILVGVILGLVWGVQQTQGTLILEFYRWLGQPFTIRPSPQERLKQAEQSALHNRVVELEAQNRQLQKLLKFSATQPAQHIIAPVIGRSADNWWQQLTLGKGSRDRVDVNQIVLAPSGLVGRVIQVTPHTSRVLLLSDRTSRIGVILSRSRFVGVLRGQSNNRAVLEFYDKDPDVRKGDWVTTSALSQWFPPGLPIGRVIALNLSKGPAPEATIELTAPFNFLETVLILPPQTLRQESPPPNPSHP
jgi:rod shape-determining protein MreC